MYWMAQAPIWLIGLLMVACLTGVYEVAYRIGRRFEPEDARHEQSGYFVPSALTLLGLMMAFSFGAAQDRFNQRREMVVAEANALGTAYLRFQTLNEPWRTTLSRQMLRYADAREAFFSASGDPGRLSANVRQTAMQQGPMWETVADAVRANPTSTINPPLVQAVNEMFDIAASRLAVQRARIPATVLRMLLVYAVVVAGIVGYAGAADHRRGPLALPVFVLAALALALILDLDRPTSGTVRIDEAPMVQAVAAIRRSEALKVSAAAPGAGSAPGARSSPAED